jgi:hypothetical protein
LGITDAEISAISNVQSFLKRWEELEVNVVEYAGHWAIPSHIGLNPPHYNRN